MAEVNYDEVTHSVYPSETMDPMYHWDAHFPERFSRLHLSLELFSSPACRRNRRAKDRAAARYKTQPVTFDEITEVDEDALTAAAAAAVAAAAAASSSSVQDQDGVAAKDAAKINLKNQLTGFSRSFDGLVAGYRLQAARSGTSTGSDKENTPCSDQHPVSSAVQYACAATTSGEMSESGIEKTETGTAAGDESMAQFTGISLDGGRHRRKRSNRKLRNRNTVEEVPETEKIDDSDEKA